MRLIPLLVFLPLAVFSQKRSADAQKHFLLGEELFQLSDWVPAIQHYDTCISFNPIHFEAYYSRAIARERIGDDHGAVADYGAMIHLDPTFTESYWNRGRLYDQIGYYDQAMDDFLQLLQIPEDETNAVFFRSSYPESGVSDVATLETMQGQIYNQLGLTAHKKGSYDLAIGYFTEAFARSRTADILVNRAMTYEEMNNTAFAINDLRLANQMEPDNSLVLYNLARAEKSNKNKVDVYTKIIGQNPEFSEAYAQRGIAKMKAGDLPGAKVDYDSAIIYAPDDGLLWKNRGILHYQLKEFHRASSDLTKATALDGQLYEAYFYLGNVDMQLEQYPQAIAHYTISLQLHPDQQNAFYNRGIAKHRSDMLLEACLDIQQAISLGMDKAKGTFKKMCK